MEVLQDMAQREEMAGSQAEGEGFEPPHALRAR